jgi:hypothetical protein
MVSFFQVACPDCGEKNKSGARFCGACGASLPGSELKCGNCGETVAADRTFCGNCGKPLSESAAPTMAGNRWARRTDDFATKVEVDDVEGFFKRGLIVEAGTKAIFFVNGAYSGILDPGRYDMGGLLQRLKNIFNYKTTTAVLVDTGDVELQFAVSGLATRDPIRLSAESRLVVQMENPTQFFENMMKGRQNYSLAEMKSFLDGELRNCMQQFIRTKSVEELQSDASIKSQMEESVAKHLATTFNRKGLTFVQVRIFDFRHPRTDAITNKQEEYWLHAQDLQTKLEGEGSTMGLERKLMDQDTAKGLMQLEVYEDRAKVFARMRKAIAGNEMDQVTSENDLRKFLQEIDKDKLLAKEEMDALTQDFKEKKEDHNLARTHLIERLSAEQNLDKERARLSGQISLRRLSTEAVRTEEMGQLEHELMAKRKELEHRQAEEWAKVKQQLDAHRAQVETEGDLTQQEADRRLRIKKAEEDERIAREAKEAEEKLRIEKIREDERIAREAREAAARREAQTAARNAEIDADMKEAAAALEMQERLKAIKRADEDARVQREQREREGRSEITLREKAQAHEQELAKIQVLSTLSTEALIAASPSEQAAMLVDLKRTESLKGFTEEQILAMAAEKNPEVAKAFQEKFKGRSTAEVEKAYERMLQMREKGIEDIKEMSRDHAKQMQEMFNKGMETQRDTATAAAKATQPDTLVISSTGAYHAGRIGGPGTLPPGRPDTQSVREVRTIVCQQCHQKVDEGQKFCDTCGFKMFG